MTLKHPVLGYTTKSVTNDTFDSTAVTLIRVTKDRPKLIRIR